MRRADLHGYLRTLEEVLIETLGAFGLKGERMEGLTGVWVDGAKVAAIGVRAKRYILSYLILSWLCVCAIRASRST